MQIQFGQVYEINSFAGDARERAEALVAEKQAQGISAQIEERIKVVAGNPEILLQEVVFMNEGNDNALDIYEQSQKAELDHNVKLLKKYNPAVVTEEMTLEDVEQQMETTYFSLSKEDRRAFRDDDTSDERHEELYKYLNLLRPCLEFAQKVFFDGDGQEITETEYDTLARNLPI